MTIKQIAKILDLHDRNYYIENERIIVDVPTKYSLLWDHLRDLTNCTRNELNEFLKA